MPPIKSFPVSTHFVDDAWVASQGIIRKSRGATYLCPECRTEFKSSLDDLPSNIILNRILESLGKNSNSNTPCKPETIPENTKATRAPPPIVPTLPPKPPQNRAHQVYRALYDYQPCKSDELDLKKSELYIVIDQRKDGWFKGSSIQTLKTGFFPGNYVQHIKYDKQQLSANSSTQHEKDLIDFRSDPISPSFKHQMKVFNTQHTIVPPNITSPSSTKIPHPKSTRGALAPREKFKCIATFPASGKYELNMEENDIVYLNSRREDGWCKGTSERTGQVGLFPISFVTKINPQ
nr:E3 ubiquitin-protein ligase SH3RF1-like isoform X2 [Lepeophtheirus salmonis]